MGGEVKDVLKLLCNTCGVQYQKLGAVLSSPCVAFPMCIVTNCCWSFVYWVIIIYCIFVTSCMLLYYVCIAVLTLDAGLLARSQYPEGPATGHLDTGFS